MTLPRRSARHNAAEQILGWQASRGLGDTTAILAGERRLSYAELSALTNRVGNALIARGIKRGERVILLMADSPEFVAAYLAIMRIGAVALALNLRASSHDIAHALQDSACAAAFVASDFREQFDAGVAEAGHAPRMVVDDLAAFAAPHPETLAPAPVRPDDMAFWLYTSGTTGKPRAVIHCHRDVSIGDLHLRQNLEVRPGDVVFATSKLFFAFSLGHCLIGALKCGAAIVLHDGWPDVATVAQLVERHRPDVFFSVPTFYRGLLREGLARKPAFRNVRAYVSAGEKLPHGIGVEWLATVGRPILEGIGTTETIFLAIANTRKVWRTGSIGRPMPWAEVMLRGEDGQPVDTPDTPGVLWVRMASVAAGYWNHPEKTAESFQDGWYRTGDMCTFDRDGWWYHQGRADDLLKISGQWVSPSEIEDRALQVPGVADAAVVGLTNEDGLVRLALAVVPSAEGPASQELEERLRQHLENNLSIYKCPRRIRFLDELPRTATGKVQRFRIRAMLGESP